MILTDTSVWIEHFRTGNAALSRLLADRQVLMHPFVVGEIACGSLTRRKSILENLEQLPSAPVANHSEVLYFIEKNQLAGRGIGYIDAHLLASVSLAPSARLWTRDKRLEIVAKDMRLAHMAKTH